MDKKQKIRVVVIMPVVATLVVLGAVVYFVLQVASVTPPGSSAQSSTLAAANATTSSPAMAPVEHDNGHDVDAHGVDGNVACDFDTLVGSDLPTARREIARTGRIVRPLREGDAATMDFNPERVNIILDETGRVLRVTCG